MLLTIVLVINYLWLCLLCTFKAILWLIRVWMLGSWSLIEWVRKESSVPVVQVVSSYYHRYIVFGEMFMLWFRRSEPIAFDQIGHLDYWYLSEWSSLGWNPYCWVIVAPAIVASIILSALSIIKLSLFCQNRLLLSKASFLRIVPSGKHAVPPVSIVLRDDWQISEWYD